MKTGAGEAYLCERGVLCSTFVDHGGEIQPMEIGTIARRLNRNPHKVRLSQQWSAVESILWFRFPGLKDEKHSHYLARPLPWDAKKKFLLPNGSNSVPWIPPETCNVAKDIGAPLVIVEGPVRAMVLLQAQAHPISLQGVWGLAAPKKKKKAKLECGEEFEDDEAAGDNNAEDEDDGRLKLRPEIACFELWKRPVHVCLDADNSTNERVRQALIRSCFLLHSAGAKVSVLSWPSQEGNGIDDYLAGKAGTDPEKQAQAFAELVKQAKPFIETFEQSDLPIIGKELHRTISNPAVFDELAGRIAKRLKVSKASFGKFRHGKEEDQQPAKQTKEIEQIEPWPEPVSLHEAFSGAVTLVRTYMFMTEAQIVAVMLWCATTFFYDLLQIHAYLGITAPTKQCGKTTLINLVALFVRQGLIVAGRVSAAFIYRAIDRLRPTFIVDEAQAIFRKSPDVEDIYNAGHVKSTANVGLVDKTENGELVERLFNVFCPKVIGLKGKIRDDSLQDRVIEIRLSRIHESDLKEDFWDVFGKIPQAELFIECRRKFVRAVMDCAEAFKNHEPQLPKFSNGRLKQNWKPLWTLAELADQSAGTEYWCSQLTEAIEECEEEALAEPPFQDYLVKSLKEFCYEYRGRPGVRMRKPEQRDLIPTQEILSQTKGLNADKEAPWFAKNNDGLTPERLARELRGFKVKKIQMQIGGERLRGYSYKALVVRVFKRYANEKSS
jgi:hypothetical protein